MPGTERTPRRRALVRLAWAAGTWLLPPLARAEQAPAVQLLGVDRIVLGGDGATLDLRLRLDNPHVYPLPLHALRLRCAFDGIALAHGRSLQPVLLPPHGSAVLLLRLDVDANSLLAVLATLPPDGVVDYTLDGDAEIGLTQLRVPVHVAGRIALPKP